MVSTSDFKRGLKLLIDGQPYSIISFEHFKPGKGNQFTRTKLKNLITGSNLDKTIKSGERFSIPDIEYKNMSFLYASNDDYNFMNQSSYEQIVLNSNLVGDGRNFLIDGLVVKLCFFNEKPVSIELPASVELKVTYTEPGHKGNTVTGASKSAELETGYKTLVPLHINIGDTLKINTESGEYIERV